MSSLQCPATLLVAPASSVEGLNLAQHRVAHVWSDPEASARAEAAATRLGVGLTVCDDVAGHESLGAIADTHPGETVLVVSSTASETAQLLVDADGWSRRPWGEPAAAVSDRS